jgi:PAS domain S-box-containing protein
MGNVHMALVELNMAQKVSTSSQSATGGGSTL